MCCQANKVYNEHGGLGGKDHVQTYNAINALFVCRRPCLLPRFPPKEGEALLHAKVA